MTTDSDVPQGPSGMTLADIRLVRTVGTLTQTYTGQEIARLIDATGGDQDRDDLLSAGEIAADAIFLANTVGAIAVAIKETNYDADEALFFVQRSLKRLANRIAATDPCLNMQAGWYQVEPVKETRG